MTSLSVRCDSRGQAHQFRLVHAEFTLTRRRRNHTAQHIVLQSSAGRKLRAACLDDLLHELHGNLQGRVEVAEPVEEMPSANTTVRKTEAQTV